MAQQSPQTAQQLPPDWTEYYAGFPGNPKLLARSSRATWTQPTGSYNTLTFPPPGPARKLSFVITGHSAHSLSQKLDNGLRDSILAILDTMSPKKWISVDYLRIGYDEEAVNNPVVVLITVEKDIVSPTEAQRIVDEIHRECEREDLHDIDAEIMEGSQVEFADNDTGPIPRTEDYPLVGSSLAISRDHADIFSGTGTLGGYVLVDGKCYALTNSHVVFGDKKSAYSADDEPETAQITIMQPSEKDLEARIADLERQIDQELETPHPLDEHLVKYYEQVLDHHKKRQANGIVFGRVWRSSGIRVDEQAQKGRRHRLDWALIEPHNPNRIVDTKKLVNQLHPYSLQRTCKGNSYFKSAMKLGHDEKKTIRDMPSHLGRALTWAEVKNRQETIEMTDGKYYAVWKFGRTSHYTCGIASGIQSNYQDQDGMVSDEWMVKDNNVRRRYDSSFSKPGDSGAFVWDCDGYVSGMLWGGKNQTFVSYVTPIEVVLEDIKRVCKAKEVRLVVRPEEDINVVFGPPKQSRRGLDLESNESGFSLFDDDIDELFAELKTGL